MANSSDFIRLMNTPGVKPTDQQRFLTEVALKHSDDPCLWWPYTKSRKGYGRLRYTENKKKKGTGAHRVVCEIVNGPPPTDRHEAAHSCGNSGCVNPCHLSWKTPAENTADKVIHGTDNAGERNGNSKLTAAQVVEIRNLRGKARHKDIAARFGVARSLVTMVQSGTMWRHVV